MFTTQKNNALITVLIFLLLVYTLLGQEYSTILDLFSDKLSSTNYNPKVRPILNQSHILEVNVSFELLSIVKLNDVQQSFTCNGFLAFFWKDEILVWNSTQYGGQKFIHPVPEDIWRPRVVVMNTLQDRDPFKDDFSPVFVKYNGVVAWIPGSLFIISCELDLTDYPFDHQTCKIQKEVAQLKAKANLRSALHHFTNFKTTSTSTKRRAVNVPYPQGQQPIMDALSHVKDINLQQVDPEDRQTKDDNPLKIMENKYKSIGKHIDLISFLVFFVIWLGVTFGFLFSIAF